MKFAPAMAKLGSRVSIITLYMPGQKPEMDSVHVYGIPASLLPPGTLGALFYVLWALLLLVLHRHEYQVILAEGLVVDGVIGCLACRILRGKRVVVRNASAGPFGDLAALQRTWLSGLRQGLLRRADGFLALTPEVRYELENWGYPSARIWNIPWGVDTQVFRPFIGDRRDLRRRIGLDPEAQWVVYIGRFVSKKRVSFLLDAWRHIQQVQPKARLLLVGTGPLEPELKSQVKKLELESTVCFFGATDRVVEILQASDVFVLPSVSEGLAIALLEAMACGLPVVTTDTLGTRSVLEDGKEGLLFEQDNQDAMIVHLLALLREPILAQTLGRQARAKAVQFFSLDRVAKSFLAACRRLAT